MYKYILAEGGNINWMAIFALLTFFTIFALSVWLAMRKDKSTLNHMANLPLEDDSNI